MALSHLSLLTLVLQLAMAHASPLQPDIKFGKSLSFAVVRPFTEKDASLFMHNMMRHREVWQSGCRKKDDFDKVDLIFYFNKEISSSMPLFSQLSQLVQSNATACFHNVKFLSARLSEEEDGYPRGCCHQFFKLFLNQELRAELGSYQSVFLMEPDVYPMKPGWLDKIVEEAVWMKSSGLWVSGPVYDIRDVPEDHRFLPWYSDQHINGNAIYNFDDDSYFTFLQDAYAHAVNHCYYGDYDEKIWQHVLNSNQDTIKNRFHASDLVGHCKTNAGWDPHLTLEQAQHRYPSAYLIHSQPLMD